MAKKQKDKKINNGRHNNTQTNRQYNGQETQRQKDKLFLSFCFLAIVFSVCLCIIVSTLFIFLSFCFLAIILSVCLCIIVSTVVYLFVFLFLGHYIVCLSVYYCVNGQETKGQKDKQRSTQ
jgi:uncharacterized membrane protein